MIDKAKIKPTDSKARKILRYLVIAPLTFLAIILLLLSIGIFFLSSTQSGTSLLLNRISNTFADLNIEGVKGSLLGDLDIQHIFWEKDGLEIDVVDAQLQTLDLFPSVSLDSLKSTRITISLPENEQKKQYEPFAITLPDLHLPIDIDLKSVDVDELHVKQGDALVKLRNVHLSANIIEDKLTLHSLSGDLYDDAGEVIVKAKGNLGLSSPHPIDLDLTVNSNSTRMGVGELDLSVKGEMVGYELTTTGHWSYGEYPKYQLSMLGKGNLEQLNVEKLHLDGAAGIADLTGRMTWSPELNWELTLTGDGLNPAEFVEDYSGDLAMEWVTTGTLTDKANIQLELKKLTGKLKDYPIDASMQLTIKDEIFSLTSLKASVGDNHLKANGQATGIKNNVAIKWQLNAPKLDQLHESIRGKLKGSGKLTGKFDGSLLSLFIEELKGKILDYPLEAKGGIQLDGQLISAKNLQVNIGKNQINLNGSADENHGIDWKINAKKLNQLYPEITGKLNANGNVKGLLDGSRGQLHIANLHGKVQQFPVKASGDIKLQDKIVTLTNVLLGVGNNKLTLAGNSADDLGIHWQLDAKNLNQLYADIKGHVNGSGQLSGALDGSSYQLRVAQLTGKVEGRPLDIKGDVVSEAGELNLNNVTVVAGKNHLQANGKANEPFDLKWNIDAPKLEQVWPGLGGRLKGQGTLKGNLETLQVQADLKGKRLRYEDLSIASVDVKADQRGNFYTLKASLKDLKQADNVIKSALIDGKGSLENHTVKLTLDHNDGKLDMLAQGAWQHEQWRGQLKKLGLKDTPAGDWKLTKPVRIKASKQQATSSKFCLTHKQRASLCADGQWSANQNIINAKGKLKQIPLAMGKPWIPDNITLPGLVNADFDFKYINGRPSGIFELQLPDSSIIVKDKKGRPETLQYTNAYAKATIKGKRAKLQANLDLKGRGTLNAEGRIELADNNKHSRINAKATISIPDIHWMQQFSNDIDELKGTIGGNVVIKGTLEKPVVTGSAELNNGSLFLPETGVRLNAIQLTAKTNRADQMVLTGSLKSGEGRLDANGKLYLANVPNWKADLTLKGERLLLMNTHEIQALVSPKLVIKAEPKAVIITGVLKIPETTVVLRELPTTAKQRSDDIVIVGRNSKSSTSGSGKEERAPAIAIKPNVVIELGNKVSFSGFGFNSRLTGRIRVQKTRQDIVTQGVLHIVDGIYEAYGQSLEIEKGRLIFDGSIDNPGLDIRAIRRIPKGDILVGIGLRGTAQYPESELFSEPPQTETDTLSYLLTGNSVSSATSGDSALLSSAIKGLGIKGGESMAQKLGGQLGLDDVGIASSTGDYKDSELSLGKQIGTKLYVKYIVGLFDSLQKVAVTYQINERLQAEVLSGEQQEIDLNYKFDTNKGLFGR